MALLLKYVEEGGTAIRGSRHREHAQKEMGSGGGRWKETVLVTQLNEWSWKEVLWPRGGIPPKGL